MPVTFAALPPERLDELVRFLVGVFSPDSEPLGFRGDVMRWKLFAPHPFWPGSRSHVFEKDGEIAAHGTVAPVRFASGGRLVDSMQIIDWAGGPLIPGGGLLLYRKCLEISGTLLAIGGSADSRKLFPQVKWFRRLGDVRRYARPLRALPPSGGPPLKALAKRARRALWRLQPALPAADQWRCEPVAQFSTVFEPRGSFTPIHRSAEWLNYLMACPALPFEGLALRDGERLRGHALLAHAGGQARVVDFVIDDEDPAAWAAAFAAIIRTLRARPTVLEVATSSSLPTVCAAFEACGLRLRNVSPVHLADPRKALPTELPLEINMLIGDAAYLVDTSYPYWC